MDDKIISYIQGSLSPKERQSLLEESRNNEQLRQALINQIECETLLSLHPTNININEGKRHLHIFKAHLKIKKRLKAIRIILRYAAVLLIGMVSMWFLSPVPKLTIPSPVMQTISVPYAQHCQMTLPDGSKVWLNSNTTLSYATPFIGKRKICLCGEALFEVAKNKNIPFIVNSKDINVEAIGTKFNVRSYADIPIKVTLFDGIVRVSHEKEPNKGILLTPNHSIIATENGFEEIAFDKESTNWKNGILHFQSMPLLSITKQLQHYYGVKIIIKKKEIMHIKYSGKFRTSDDAAEILRVLSRINDFKVSQREQDKQIIIY